MTKEEYPEWFDSLKPGDKWETVEQLKYGSSKYVVRVEVLRLTEKQIVVRVGKQDQRYWRSTRRLVGNCFATVPNPATVDELAEVRAEQKHRALSRKLSEVRWNALSIETLEKINALVDEEKKGCATWA